MDVKRKPKRIVMCADDFGMNPSIDAGILRLAELGRLSATSCLVQGPAFGADVTALKGSGLQMGLHLNFTEAMGQSGFFLPLSSLIRQAYLYRLNAAQLREQIVLQLDLFEAAVGGPPDFIDGHQHVHQLPQIRDELFFELTRRYRPGTPRPWLRYTKVRAQPAVPMGTRFKAYVIQLLGSGRFAALAKRDGFALNAGFLGVYDFSGGQSGYSRLLESWLGHAQDGDLLMCHPAQGVDATDGLAEQRVAEFETLAGDDAGRWLSGNGLVLDLGVRRST